MNKLTTAIEILIEELAVAVHLFGDTTPYSDKPDIRIMQYTGLKDTIGVEIYEGDIVHYQSPGGIFTIHGVVEYLDEQAGFRVKTTEKPDFLMLSNEERYPFKWNDVEVIGNIYETPELLGSKENVNERSTNVNISQVNVNEKEEPL